MKSMLFKIYFQASCLKKNCISNSSFVHNFECKHRKDCAKSTKTKADNILTRKFSVKIMGLCSNKMEPTEHVNVYFCCFFVVCSSFRVLQF